MKRHQWILITLSFVTLTIVLFVHQPSFAQDHEPPTVSDSEQEEQEPLPFSEESDRLGDHPVMLVLKMLFYTMIVGIMIYGLSRFLAVRQRKIQHHRVFQNLGGTPLGQNKSLQIIEIGGTLYLLGVSETITLIKEIKDEDQINKIYQDLEEQNSLMSTSLLPSLPWMQKRDKDNEEQKRSFQNLFQQSLKEQHTQRSQLEQRLAEKSVDKEGRSS